METVSTLVLNTILDMMQNELSQMQDPTDSFDFTSNKSISAIELSNWLSTVTFDLVEVERKIEKKPKLVGLVDQNGQLIKFRNSMIQAINAKFKYVGLFDQSKDVFQSPFQLTKGMNMGITQFEHLKPANAKEFFNLIKLLDFNNQESVKYFVRKIKDNFNGSFDQDDPYVILTIASALL